MSEADVNTQLIEFVLGNLTCLIILTFFAAMGFVPSSFWSWIAFLCCAFVVSQVCHQFWRYRLPPLAPRLGLSAEDEAACWLLDTSALIDGRLLALVQEDLIVGELYLPRFVLDELQGLADRGSETKRARGRRGLETGRHLAELLGASWQVIEAEREEGEAVDKALIRLAGELDARIISTDSGLLARAKIENVKVLDLNGLCEHLTRPISTGERLEIMITKKGEGAQQGVGHLGDGTMVVVEKGVQHVGEEAIVEVVSSIRTKNGVLVFATYEGRPERSPT